MKLSNKPINFDKSKLKDAFTRELYWLCHQIETDTEKLFSDFKTTSGKVFISAKIDELRPVYTVLSNAAKIQELTHSYQKEKHHKDRAKYFTDLLSPLGITEIYEKKVRNSIEHFSEYLDKANRKHTLLESKDQYVVAFNLIVSHWQQANIPGLPFNVYKTHQLQHPIYPVRVYVADEKRFYNMQFSIDVTKIRDEAILIKNHIKSQGLLEGDTPEDWMSWMQVF